MLALALAKPRVEKRAQLDLFGGSAGGTPLDPLLATLLRQGGASWVRTVDAIDDAIGILRANDVTAEMLERIAKGKGVAAARANTLAVAMRALDEALARANMRDERVVGAALAKALASTKPATIADVVAARELRARFILAWDASDLAWWRVLDDKLGSARIVLPSFERARDPTRERDPFETLAEAVTRGLDAPIESDPIPMVLGDLAGGPSSAPERVRLFRASDPVAQARAVTRLVEEALAGGARVERIAIACPSADERSLAPLRRALEDAGIVAFEARGAPAADASVVATALLALEIATRTERELVAWLLRSGYVDTRRLLGDDARPIASALERNATASGADARERLVATAKAPAVGSLFDVIAAFRKARTRRERAAAARTMWTELGLGARAGLGGRATFAQDEAPTGVARAQRLAIARDARAWEALLGAIDLYESAADAAGDLDEPIDDEVFRLEIIALLEAASARPGAGRAGAVRIARLADTGGEVLDLLVVLDANEGTLPRDVRSDALVSDSLAALLARARGEDATNASTISRARELGALALAAAEAKEVVLVALAEDGSGATLAPASVVDVLARTGVPIGSPPSAETGSRSSADVELRAARERAREAFFLDPARKTSDLVADLRAHPELAPILAERTGAESALAVTALERFAKCPFMGYADVILSARETERQMEIPDPREEGNVGHAALAAAFLATRALWPIRPRPDDSILAKGLAAADAVLEKEAAGHAPLRAVMRLRARESVRAVLLRAIEDDEWDFALAEQAFEPRTRDGVWPPFTIGEGDARVVLRGKIDRIDRAHDGSRVRVLDYKRSKNAVRSAASGLGETALQVPLYARVATKQLGIPATGGYAVMQPRDIAMEGKPSARASQKIDDLVASGEIEKRCLAVVTSARAGLLAPLPAKETECQRCSASGACRKPRFAMAPLDENEEEAP